MNEICRKIRDNKFKHCVDEDEFKQIVDGEKKVINEKLPFSKEDITKTEMEEAEKRRKEEQKRKAEEQKAKEEEQKRKLEEQKRKAEEQKAKEEEQKRKLEEQKRKAEEQKAKEEEEEEKRKSEEKKRKKEIDEIRLEQPNQNQPMQYTGNVFKGEIVEKVNEILLFESQKKEPKNADTITYENTINFIIKLHLYAINKKLEVQNIDNKLIEYFIRTLIANKDKKNYYYYGKNKYPFSKIKDLKEYDYLSDTNNLIFKILREYLDFKIERKENKFEKEFFFAFDNNNAKFNLSLIDKTYEIILIETNGKITRENGWMIHFLVINEEYYGKILPAHIKFFKDTMGKFFKPLLKLVINGDLENNEKKKLQVIFKKMFIDREFNSIFFRKFRRAKVPINRSYIDALFYDYLFLFINDFPNWCEEKYNDGSEEFKTAIKILKNAVKSNETNLILFVSSLFLSLGLLGAYFAFNKKKFNNYNY
jgi:hypothetical protein